MNEDLDFSSAQSAFIAHQSKQIEDLNKRLEVAELTEGSPLSSNEGEVVEPQKGAGFSSKINIV